MQLPKVANVAHGIQGQLAHVESLQTLAHATQQWFMRSCVNISCARCVFIVGSSAQRQRNRLPCASHAVSRLLPAYLPTITHIRRCSWLATHAYTS